MHIGIITFHASFNYGSMLQAWALQTYLEKQGHHVEIINYRSKYQKKHYARPFDLTSIDSIKSSLKRLALAPSSFPALYKKWYLFNEFLHQELHITKEYNTEKDLENAHLDYDIIITGSDQIWINTREAGSPYFANFTNPKIRKIAYAPSMGPLPENTPSVEFFKKNLKNFDAVSVRELRSKNYLEDNQLFHPVEVVCDPTMLLNRDDYNILINPEPLIKESYIFLYTPGKARPAYFSIAEQIAKENNMVIITETPFYPRDINNFPHIKLYPEAGPKEFLNLIKNADFVVGGSFHLLVFSLLFRKNFFCINGDKDFRTNNLLRITELENRAVSLDNPSALPAGDIIDYDYHINNLSAFQESSKLYLNKFSKL